MDRRIRRLKRDFIRWANTPTWIRWSLERALEVELLGSGCYASVYAIDDERVLKVLDGVDEGYERFIRKARRSWSPFLPRVHYSGTWAGKRVFILERLDVREDDETEEFVKAVEFIAEHGAETRWMKCVHPDLANIVDFLVKNDCCNDIHGGNILWRGNQPVITDPAT